MKSSDVLFVKELIYHRRHIEETHFLTSRRLQQNFNLKCELFVAICHRYGLRDELDMMQPPGKRSCR